MEINGNLALLKLSELPYPPITLLSPVFPRVFQASLSRALSGSFVIPVSTVLLPPWYGSYFGNQNQLSITEEHCVV